MPDNSPNTGTSATPAPDTGNASITTPDLPAGNPGQSVQQALDAFADYQAGTAPEVTKPAAAVTEPPAAAPSEPSEESFEGHETADLEPAQELEPAPEETPPPALTQPSKSTRDYSDIAPEDVPYFRQMSRKAFEYLKPKYLEHQKLSKDLAALQAQANDFQSLSDAYQLTPEYKQEVENASYLDREIAHWERQLVNIRSGKAWVPIVTDPQGNPVLGEPVQPLPAAEDGSRQLDVENEVAVMRALSTADRLKHECLSRANGLKESYTAQHKSFNDGIAAARKEIFKGIDEKQLSKLADSKLSIFPPALRGDSKVRIIAELLAVIDGFDILLRQAKGQVTNNTARTTTAVNAGPKARTMVPGAKPNTVGAAQAKFDAWKRGLA